MSNVNVPLLRKAVEWVEEQDKLPLVQSQWNQGNWVTSPENWAADIAWETGTTVDPAACGTAYCVAGYIGQMLNPEYKETSIVDDVHVSDFAAEALGLEYYEADELFSGSNEAEDVRRIAERIAGERL